jgi:hypothetical protein
MKIHFVFIQNINYLNKMSLNLTEVFKKRITNLIYLFNGYDGLWISTSVCLQKTTKTTTWYH